MKRVLFLICVLSLVANTVLAQERPEMRREIVETQKQPRGKYLQDIRRESMGRIQMPKNSQ